MLAFAPALAGGFVHDDRPQILANPLVAGLRHLPELWATGAWAGAGSGSSFYRPLMTTSFALDRALFGTWAPAWHAVQLALWAAVVAVAARLMAAVEGRTAVAGAAAAIAAVHPVNAEAAAWISARCELLAATGVLVALLLHDGALAGRRPTRAGVPVAIAVALGLFAKESAICVLPALAAVDRARGASFAPRALAARHAATALALAGYAALRARALGGVGGGLAGALDPLAALGAAGQGLARLALPVGLTIAPPPPGPAHAALGGAAALAGAAGLALAWRRRSPALVPLVLGGASLGVAAVAAARIGELADRYLVLPALAVAWLAARAVDVRLRSRRGAGRALAAAAVLLLGALAFRHVQVYASDGRLWRDAWSKNPASVRAATNLAAWHLDAGAPREALVWLARAEALAPGDRLVALDRAAAHEELGDAAAARRELEALAASDPTWWPARLRLGHLALGRGELATAAAEYEATLTLHPLCAEAFAGLGVTRYQQGRREEAGRALARALALDPQVQNAGTLRRLLQETSR